MAFPDVLPLLREAGRLMTSAEHPAVYEKEGHSNFVTESDLAVQKFLISGLSAVLPESCFFAEEQEQNRLTEAPTWVIDPIDGTLNFMRQRRTSAISVALLYEKVPRFAWIYDPYQQRMYQAEKGKGAFCNGHRLEVSQYPFEQALVGYGTSPYDSSLAQKGAACALSFLQKAADLRRSGSAVLDFCDLAAGRLEIFFELCLSPWDYAAGALLVEEAGGVFSMPFEEKMRFDRPAGILAATPLCVQKALEVLTSFSLD